MINAIVLMGATLLPVPGLGRCSTNTEMGDDQFLVTCQGVEQGFDSPHRHY